MTTCLLRPLVTTFWKRQRRSTAGRYGGISDLKPHGDFELYGWTMGHRMVRLGLLKAIGDETFLTKWFRIHKIILAMGFMSDFAIR